MRAIILSALLFTAAGCASGMSKKECLYADWNAIGYEDGARGLDASAISSRRVACADKAQVTPDMEAYLAGRERGLEQFCRPANGFDYGSRGYRYTGACSENDEGAFVVAYEAGLTMHGLLANYDAATRALAAAHSDLDNIDAQITRTAAAIADPLTPNPDRIHMLAEMKNLHDRRDKVRDAIPRLERDADIAEAELEDFRREVSDRPYSRI